MNVELPFYVAPLSQTKGGVTNDNDNKLHNYMMINKIPFEIC